MQMPVMPIGWDELEWEASVREGFMLGADRGLLHNFNRLYVSTYPESNWRDRSEGESSHGHFRYNRRVLQPGFHDERKLIFVPTHLVGRIIGRGGTMIREIEDVSKARVKIGISRESETDIILIGTEFTIGKAERMINELLKDRAPPDSDAALFSQFLVLNSFGEYVMDWDMLLAHHAKFQLGRLHTLSPIDKDFYEALAEIAKTPYTVVAEWRLRNEVRVSRPYKHVVQMLDEASNAPLPNSQESTNVEDQEGEYSQAQAQQEAEQAYPSFGIPNPVMELFHAFHPYGDLIHTSMKWIRKPTYLQSQAWPVILSGKDVLEIAQSGTGKTLAYLLPALVHIAMQRTPRDQRKGPTMLILAPTRDLVQQIERECIRLHFRGIKTVSIFGGGDRKAQILAINNGVDIVIATPGRLNDLVMAHHINAINFTFIALDEADQMLEMGFEHRIRKSLLDVRPDRQTVITASQCSEKVLSLTKSYTKNPIQINVGSSEIVPLPGVTQKLLFIEENQKKTNLYYILKNMNPTDRVLVFCGSKETATRVFTELGQNDISCKFFNGDGDYQQDRDAIRAMRDGIANILIAPDVPCYEINLKGVTHIINMDFPHRFEEYRHRVAKTTQPGRSGTTITFITRDNWHVARPLINVLKGAQQQIPDELEQMAYRFETLQLRRSYGQDGRRGRGRGYGGRGHGRNMRSFRSDW